MHGFYITHLPFSSSSDCLAYLLTHHFRMAHLKNKMIRLGFSRLQFKINLPQNQWWIRLEVFSEVLNRIMLTAIMGKRKLEPISNTAVHSQRHQINGVIMYCSSHKSRKMKRKNFGSKNRFSFENWNDSSFMRCLLIRNNDHNQNDTPILTADAWFKLQPLPFLLFWFWISSYDLHLLCALQLFLSKITLDRTNLKNAVMIFA